MRSLIWTLSVAAALLAGGAMLPAAQAQAAVGGSSGLNVAIEELSIVDQVHCVPGWRHHRATAWRRANGCARGGVVVVPRPYWRGYHWRGGPRWHRWRR